MTLREKELAAELAGIECRCGNPKEPKRTFCRKCYYRLPERLRVALYRRIGEGYEQARDEAGAFLHAADLKRRGSIR